MMIERNLTPLLNTIIYDFNKMAFISGARQSGKTTLACAIGKKHEPFIYFNWDIITDQKKFLNNPYFFENENRVPSGKTLVVFDEIHKYSRWKNYLKGAFDKYKDEFNFIVTGSGRLDLYKKGGDSLLGRYFSAPLFPLTIGELSNKRIDWKDFKENIRDVNKPESEARDLIENLFEFSGFPEPFLKTSNQFYNLWCQERKSLLIRQDIRDGSNIREISMIEMLSHLLPERVGSPLSINSLREDVNVSYDSIAKWMSLLHQFYYSFLILPFSGKLSRTLKKEPKIYLYDWREISDKGKRFENLVALHLLKAVSLWTASGYKDISLRYIRDKEKREVDFVICEKNNPVCLVECKFNDDNVSQSLIYYQNKLKVENAFQLVYKKGVCKKIKNDSYSIWILSADYWLNLLP